MRAQSVAGRQDGAHKTYLKLDNAIEGLVKADPVCKLLVSVPGVGPVTALSFRAGVDDPGLFTSSRTVAAHFGLTPRRFQSGESDNPGHISRAGDADVRSALYVAAHSLLTRNEQWSSLKAWGIRLSKTRGHRRAVIAVARKLAVILHRIGSMAQCSVGALRRLSHEQLSETNPC